jgi:cellulose synthase/poly-beta-1,6-N-acetylglucosamine synthase-like glycosyltransferase
MSVYVFWGALALIAYTYLIFPILLALRGMVWRRPVQVADIEPTVSMIIAAYNEADTIAAKIENLLALDYPPDRLEVVIASDGSDDDTVAVASRYASERIRVLDLPRLGKAGALNEAVRASRGEILVFSDANSMYAPDAIRALVRPFADPTVGGVAGNQRYLSGKDAGQTGAGERSYWSFDRLLKRTQSRAGNTISATGAIYAIRRTLFQPVPEGVTDDFVTSTRVIAQGYRLVFAPDAVAYEPVAHSSDIEFGRKVRVITRGLRGVLVMRELLNPLRHGFYAVQLLTHKVLRRLMFAPLLALLAANFFLWDEGLFYRLTLLAQLGFYGSALLGWVWQGTRWGRLKVFAIPFYFCVVYAAALLATWNVLRGQRITRWTPQRQKGFQS